MENTRLNDNIMELWLATTTTNKGQLANSSGIVVFKNKKGGFQSGLFQNVF